MNLDSFVLRLCRQLRTQLKNKQGPLGILAVCSLLLWLQHQQGWLLL